MKMDRIKEILARKAEIRSMLESGDKVDLGKLEEELRDLNQEQKDIETRQRLLDEAGEINEGKGETRRIETFNNKPPEERTEVTTESMEYRKAFKDFVLRNQKADVLETRATSTTGDIGTVIPQTIINRIIEKMKAYGMIFSRITTTNVKGGVSISTSNLKPTATWTAEGAVSAKQNKTTGSVTFSYHKLQCRVAVTLEADTVSMDIFESSIVDNIYEAMIIAIENAVISGTGVQQPLGIVGDAKVTNEVLVADADIKKYEKWTAIISQIPLSAEGRVAITMTKVDWDKNILGMTDANGQPIARVSYGLDGRPQRRFLGYEVILVEDYLPTHAAAADGDVFAIICDYKDYVLNSNMQYTYKKYFDEDTDEYIHKTTLIADGKLADGQNVLLLKKQVVV
jgi:HK97 family phage major capsid protein